MANQVASEIDSPIESLSDSQIDALIRQVAEGESRGPSPPVRTTGFWYLAAFLLGMTAMEGLRFVAPSQREVRSVHEHRCGTPNLNPGAPASVAGPLD